MNAKEETKSSDNLFYRAVNNFVVKAATIIYLLSALCVLFQYLNGSNNIYLVSLCIVSTILFPVVSRYFMKTDRDEMVPCVFLCIIPD